MSFPETVSLLQRSKMSKQKSALITGCSAGGLGDALAQAFHREGVRVFATARSVSKIRHLEEMGMVVLELDVTDRESVARAVSAVKATSGALDILVNNAGVGE
jgi:1-acylglycerone phosphate reductase